MQYGTKFKVCVAEKMLVSLVASQVGMTERQLKYFIKKWALSQVL
jgi:sulfur relay (sulfurtransferase) DsrC/TusE family protein